MGKIRLAIVGVGNCASSLIQGIYYYKGKAGKEFISGVMHNEIGGYRIDDIEPVAAFDVDAGKVGKDLSEAIFAAPNNTVKTAKVPKLGVTVMMGSVLDGIGEYMSSVISVSPDKNANVAKVLKDSKVDVVVNFLPVGSAKATRFYAEEAIKAGCGFVNAIPEFIASDAAWEKKFRDARLPVIGDDTKSQVGSTIVHRVLTDLCKNRGAVIDHTYQLNVGGNSDFKNMLERARLKSKKISKTEAVQSQMRARLEDDDIHVGPSDYVPWLDSRKLGFIRIEGRLFGDVPFNIELRLDVEDKANSSGVVIDAIRCCKVAMDKKIGGALVSPSSYFCKHPPQQFADSDAQKMTEEFIAGKRER
ncbi:MAG: inositol-3-phosphate synthase [Candidatus Aenigmarchaeota archaeon]|nr:inositol-3-phosphate synthase [Candidatus Aenigmarchaeota archaeon]